MIINGERSLAYIAKITKIEPIPNYDRVELATINDGWRVIISKNDNFHVDDRCIYFEVDSKVPETDDRFAFLSKRNYKVKTLKMCGTISQGLVCPIDSFPEVSNKNLGEDVGKILGVEYYEPGDNDRKNYSTNRSIEDRLKDQHKKWYNTKIVKWLLKREWGRNLLNKIFKKKKNNKGFPSWGKKSDEERIENCPWYLNQDKEWVPSEKLDGSSSFFGVIRRPFGRMEFIVCSRNVRQLTEDQKCFHDYNIYWAMARKYNIEKNLKGFLKDHKELKWVYIQGESVGKVQGNPLKLKEDDLYCYNFVDSKNGRYDSRIGKGIVEKWGMKWVPLFEVTKLPTTMEEMKALSHGNSVVTPSVLREGLVYRSLDGQESFKNVDPEYLLKHNQ